MEKKIHARILDADGKVLRVMTGRPEQVALNVPEGGSYEAVPWQTLTDTSSAQPDEA